MNYDGPSHSDYANIHAMNAEFLAIVRADPEYFEFSGERRTRLLALGKQQLHRLAAAPFLLFSIQELNEPMWREVLRNDQNQDLFRNQNPNHDDRGNLLATCAGFLWQLAQRNPYTVRLFSCATSEWCELISGATYFELVSICRSRGDILMLRHAGLADIWTKLLIDGVRPERQVRTAAHLAALQSLLTSCTATDHRRWPLAARKTRPPRMRVADEAVAGGVGNKRECQ